MFKRLREFFRRRFGRKEEPHKPVMPAPKEPQEVPTLAVSEKTVSEKREGEMEEMQKLLAEKERTLLPTQPTPPAPHVRSLYAALLEEAKKYGIRSVAYGDVKVPLEELELIITEGKADLYKPLFEALADTLVKARIKRSSIERTVRPFIVLSEKEARPQPIHVDIHAFLRDVLGLAEDRLAELRRIYANLAESDEHYGVHAQYASEILDQLQAGKTELYKKILEEILRNLGFPPSTYTGKNLIMHVHTDAQTLEELRMRVREFVARYVRETAEKYREKGSNLYLRRFKEEFTHTLLRLLRELRERGALRIEHQVKVKERQLEDNTAYGE